MTNAPTDRINNECLRGTLLFDNIRENIAENRQVMMENEIGPDVLFPLFYAGFSFFVVW